ncbi:zinc-dependent metalloprotease [Planktothrix pseudagardhii]|nr:zinc-dependent metalloprotease [Planktothrix pseudagardhii]
MTKFRKAKRFVLLSLMSFLIITVGLSQVNAQEVSLSNFKDYLVAQQVTQQPFEQVIQGSEKLEGLFTIYHNKESGKVYLELKPEQLNQNFLSFATLESGIGEEGIVSGTNLRDLLFQFRSVENKIQVVVPNINFRTEENDPQTRSINRSFSESVLQTLPILGIHPERKTILIEISDLLNSQSDLPGLMIEFSEFLNNKYAIDPSKSYISQIQTFPENVEIESVFGFSLGQYGEARSIPSLPDNRTFNLKVRYSLLAVPVNNDYRPRLADERVGYFTTTYKDLSGRTDRSSIVRYINRWNLQKQDPNAALSPPIKPIKFWIENTVPLEYREGIREGILFWNKAFEQAGFLNAIQVEQMPDNAPWNPADVRYNTIRWSTSFKSSFNGYGPSHTNPFTGEILDADIIIESSALRSLQEGAGVFLDSNSAMSSEGDDNNNSSLTTVNQPCPIGLYAYSQMKKSQAEKSNIAEEFCFRSAFNEQLMIGTTALSLLENIMPNSPKMEAYIQQYLRLLISHEIGHTLGLRHNFQGSTLLSPEELNNPEITQTKGLVSSVMDYLPVNLAPQGTPQGDYFPTQIGPYDQWAIEYGYKPIASTTPEGEWQALQDIAKRATQPELAYATDEDFWGVFLDPATNTRDLSNDMLKYSQWQLDNSVEMWKRLESYTPRDGEGYDKMRKMFDTIFDYYSSQAINLTLYIGGQSFNRTRAGEGYHRLPFEPISIKKQRDALKLLQTYVFTDKIFKFSPNLLNQLAPARWSDWANPDQNSYLDYPITRRISWFQRYILHELFASTRLFRLRDLELKTTANNALTLPELFETVQNGIWSEISVNNGTIEISSIRRSLQREHLEILSEMVLRKITVPEDAETLAWYELQQLNQQLETTLKRQKDKMNAYTLAHLEQTHDRIQKILEAEVQSN